MKPIARNPYYEISVDAQKNRVYLKVMGFWRNATVVPEYVAHWEEALRQVKRNFTICADIRKMQPYCHEVQNLHEKVQAMIVKSGLLQTAEVLPRNMVMEVQCDRICRNSMMPRKKFSTAEEAEKWLDHLSKEAPRGMESAG